MSTSSSTPDEASVFSLDLVAPERVLASNDNSTMVTIPGIQGDFGVLPGHAPLVSNLRAGVVRVFNEPEREHVAERFFVSGGVAEVSHDRCIILAEQAVPISEIDEEEVSAEVAELRDKLDAAPTIQEKMDIRVDLQVAEAMLEALKYKDI